MGNANQTGQEKKVPAVNRACDRLSEELERLEKHQSELESVLESVSAQSSPEVSGKDAPPSQVVCLLEGRINDLRERVQKLVSRVVSLMDRLEVG